MSGSDAEIRVTADNTSLDAALSASAAAAEAAFSGMTDSGERAAASVTSSMAELQKALVAAQIQYQALGGAAKAAISEYISDLQGQIAAAQAVAASSKAIAAANDEVSSSFSGGSTTLQEYINTQAGLDRAIQSAAASAKFFASQLATTAEAALAAIDSHASLSETMAGEEAVTFTTTNMLGRLVTSLHTVEGSFLSAKASAAVFTEELARGNAALIGYSLETRAAAEAENRFRSSLVASTETMQQTINRTTGVGGAIKSASASAAVFAQDLATVGDAASDATGKAARGFGEAQGAGARFTGELVTIGREAMTGNFSRMPGSVLVLAKYMGNLTLVTMGTVGAFAALAFGAADLVGWLNRLSDAKNQVAAGASLFNPQLDLSKMETLRNQVKNLHDVSTDASGEIMGAFVRMRGATNETVTALVDQLDIFAQATGKKAPQAARELADAFAAPTAKGREFLESIQASDDVLKKFDESLTAGDVKGQRKEMFQALADSANLVRSRVHDLSGEMSGFQQELLNAEGAQGGVSGLGDQAAAQQKMAASKKSADDLAAAFDHLSDAQKKVSGQNSSWLDQERTKLGEQNDIIIEQAGLTTKTGVIRQQEAANAVKFWQQELESGKLTNQQLLVARREYIEAKERMDMLAVSNSQSLARQEAKDARTALAEKLAELSQMQAANKQDYALVMSLEQQKLDAIVAAGQKGTVLYENTLRERANLERQHNQEVVAEAMASIEARSRLDRVELETQKTILDAQVVQHKITHSEEYDSLKQMYDKMQQLEIADLEHLRSTLAQGTKEWEKANQAILLAKAKLVLEDDKYNAQMETDSQKSAKVTMQQWVAAFEQIGTAATRAFADMVTGSSTFLSAMQNLVKSVIEAFINLCGNMLSKWIATQVAQNVITDASLAHQVAAQQAAGASGWGSIIQWILKAVGIQSTAAATGAATTAATSVAQINASAGVAGAGAYASQAAIPIVGPELGAAAMAQAISTVESMQSLVALDVGAWDVPKDMTARIHQGEMVVPADFSSGVRSALSGGGGSSGGTGGDTHFHFSPEISGHAASVQRQVAATYESFKDYFHQVTRNGQISLPGRAQRTV